MKSFSGKNIVVGITGGIAAYKTPDLVRKLIAEGANVRVVMTRAGVGFVTPLTLQAVSGHRVAVDLVDDQEPSGMGHIELAKWADWLVVAPTTADFIAAMAQGRAHDLLSSIILATTAVTFVAPAMNQQMWQHPATQRNLQQLIDDEVRIIGPDAGEQACGDVGYGRMTEPEAIVDFLKASAEPPRQPTSLPLSGMRVLMTAGPTEEAIDPVRVISNRSSGKMGYALAEQAARLGAEVTLVSGPVALAAPPGVNVINVKSTEQMLQQVMAHLEASETIHIFVGVAAVADYRPAEIVAQKIKKDAEHMTLTLVKNPDIIRAVSAHPKRPFVVGFAAETEHVLDYARAKRLAKNLDVIIANQVNSEIGIGTDDNSAVLVSATEELTFALQSKNSLAHEIWRQLVLCYRQNNAHSEMRVV